MKKAKIVATRGIIAGLVICLCAAGCATPAGQGGNSSIGSTECNEGWMALGGAALGGLLASGNNRLRGAALGAGVAALACVAWNYNVKQTRTAQQVQADYRSANRGRMPERAQVVRYDPQFSPSGRVAPGSQVLVNSDIEVVAGTRDTAVPVVEEELTMIRPDGKQLVSRKVVNEGQGAGGYRSSFTLKMPKGVPEGEYPVKTALFLNGQRVEERSLTMQVATSAGGDVRIAIR